MANTVAVVGSTFTFGIWLWADATTIQSNPTIDAANDFRMTTNGGAYDTLDNDPTATPASGKRVQVVVSAAETTAAGAGGNICIEWADNSGAEWLEGQAELIVHAANLDSLATATALATVDTNVDSILADTGTTGVVLADNAITAAKIATDAITDDELAATATAEIGTAVWASATRTLTQSGVSVAAAVAGGLITIHRGDSLSASLTDLGDISGRSKLWFTVKSDRDDVDTASIIQIEESAGLVYINGAAAGTAAKGSITVSDEDDGDLTIALDETETDDLTENSGLYYDVQMLTAAGAVTTLTDGPARVTLDVTRAVA